MSPLILECALLDVDAVTPGEAFSVRVRARSEDGPVRVRAIDVSWHGVERLDPAWVKPEEPSEARAPKAGAGLNPGERCIAKSPAGAVAEGVVVRAGDVVERVVRVRLPPAFRGAVSRVSYFITCVAATADARDEAPDPPKAWERAHARVPLRVRAPDRDGFKNTREETTGRTDGTADGHDAGIFWMHELASAAGKTKTRAPRRASGDRRESDAKKKHNDAYPAYSAAPPSSSTTVRPAPAFPFAASPCQMQAAPSPCADLKRAAAQTSPSPCTSRTSRSMRSWGRRTCSTRLRWISRSSRT